VLQKTYLALAGAALATILMVPTAASGTSGGSRPILFLSNRSGDREIYAVNRDGTGLRRITFNNIFERAERLSPDGSHIVLTGFVGANADIYTIKADGSELKRLTTDPGRDDDPAWTSNGKRIVYDRGLSDNCSPCTLRIVNADGTKDRALEVGPGNSINPDVVGDRLAFANDRTGLYAIYTIGLDAGQARRITDGAIGWDFEPRWSPDGNEVLFLRNVANDANNDLYAVRANGSGLRQLTNTPGVTEFGASWAPDGSEIAYFGNSGGPNQISTIRSDGTGQAELSTAPKAPFDENFSDGIVDNSLWHTISDSGGTIGEVNGRLEAFISHDADPAIHNYNQVDEHIGSQCTLNGPFDFQVDYQLVTWPAHNGFFAMLNAIFADGAIARTSAPWDPPYDEQYNSWTNGGTFTNDNINTTDTGGQMRLVRQGGVLYSYERNSSSADWTFVHSGDATGNTVASMGLWAPENTFAHEDGLVAYDNFRLNSGVFTCPSWWDDAWPAWSD
jgi:Tol biopolymer transport system component